MQGSYYNSHFRVKNLCFGIKWIAKAQRAVVFSTIYALFLAGMVHRCSCCSCSVTQSCPTLCDPMGLSMPGFPVLHYLLEFAQTHVYSVHDAIQSSHSLLPPFFSCPRSFSASGSFPVTWLFASCSQSIGASASVLPMRNFRVDALLGLTGLISLLSKGLSCLLFSIIVWKYQFISTQPSLWSNSHIHTWLLEKPQLWLYRPLLAKWCLSFSIFCLGLSQFFYQGESVF